MAAGMMYIANSFKTVGRTARERENWPVDNDPHFWSSPPTWGICRPDLRRKAARGQTIFFVLSKFAQHPQMIFGYMTIDEIVSHLAAYRRLAHKRMRGASPDGNIIVNAAGRYSLWDRGSHEHNFQKIRRHYAIGNPASSRFLTPAEIKRKAPQFVAKLQEVLERDGDRPIEFISRAGCHALSDSQVRALRRWIDDGLGDDDRGFGGDTGPRVPGRPKPPPLPSSCGPGGRCVPLVPRRGRCGPPADCGPRSGSGRNIACFGRKRPPC